MERMAHHAMLEYIRTCKLPNPQYKQLNITGVEEHELREEYEERIRKNDQVFEESQMLGPISKTAGS